MVGKPVDDYIGYVRDAKKSHMCDFYIQSLKDEIQEIQR